MNRSFRQTSRYFRQPVVETTAASGRIVQAVALRKIPLTVGQMTIVKEPHRLDTIALEKYGDPTRFWRIADANTEIDSTRLIRERIQEIKVPDT